MNYFEKEAAAKPKDLYYIQNRGYSGDCLRFWRSNECGYTTNLDEALVVSKTEAEGICTSRPKEDIPWPCAYLDAIAQRHVNSECMPRREEAHAD